MVARIDAARTTISRASTRAVFTPDASATSGSKVVKSSLSVAEEDDGGDHGGDADDGPDIGRVDTEDAAEQGGVEAAAPPTEHGEERQSKGEGRGGDHPDGGVGTDDPPAGDPVDHQGGGDAPGTGAQDEVDPEERTGGETAEDGVRQPVADVAHALEHDVDADQPAQGAGEGGHDEAVAEELELERVGATRP